MNESGNAGAGVVSSGGAYAQRILPTLQRIRAARQQADALLADPAAPPMVAAGAELARATIAALDKRLRAAAIYDLAQAERLDQDAQGMAQACQLIDETRHALRELARELGQSAAPGDAVLAELIATLDADA